MTGTMTAGTISSDRDFCQAMLPKVSRTFAICIRLLPPDLEYPVLVAYLLCRVADTLEDTTRLTPLEKSTLLNHFSRSVGTENVGVEPLRDIFADWEADDELLVHNADALLREFRKLPDHQRAGIAPWTLRHTAAVPGWCCGWSLSSPVSSTCSNGEARMPTR